MGEFKMVSATHIAITVFVTALVVAPWIYVAVLLEREKDYDDEKGQESSDRNVTLLCDDVDLSPCNTLETCLVEAKKIMDVCGVLDTHNDLPYTFAKYQNADNHTQAADTRIGIDVDDTHLDLYGDLILDGADKHTNMRLIKEGRLKSQFWSIYSSCRNNFKDAVDWALEQIDVTERIINKYDEFEFVKTPYEAKEAMMAGKIASMFGLEGGHMIGSRLSVLRQLFHLGIRYMTVTHYCNTPWADQAQADDPELSHLIRNNGLSSFGKDVIREMNRLGIIVDLSHVSRATMLDALEVTKTPVIFSHSCARNLTYHIRNVPDDVLEKVKVNGGAVCVSFVPVFVKENIETDGNADVGDVADHFDYIRNKIGAEHLCIGGDYNGVSSLPDGLEDVGTYPNLVAELLRRGWSQGEIKGILQENVLRIWEEVHLFAENHKDAKPDPKWMSEDEFRKDLNETQCAMINAA